MSDQQQPSSKRHEEGQGPASLQVEGPSAGASLQDLGQPIRSQNAEEVMQAKYDHPKWHKQ